MRIQHNIMAMNAYRNYNTNTGALSKNLEKLSSGYKINRAGDDAAGLAISEKMRAQITGLNAAQKNVKDGISLVKTAEGAMQEIQDMLNRMDYLATQSANGTYDNDVDRAALQKEVNQLRSEINRIAESANFNGTKLLDGSLNADGTPITYGGASRLLANDAGENDDVTAVGTKNFYDGAGGTEDKATKFELDFSDVKVETNAPTFTSKTPAVTAAATVATSIKGSLGQGFETSTSLTHAAVTAFAKVYNVTIGTAGSITLDLTGLAEKLEQMATAADTSTSLTAKDLKSVIQEEINKKLQGAIDALNKKNEEAGIAGSTGYTKITSASLVYDEDNTGDFLIDYKTEELAYDDNKAEINLKLGGVDVAKDAAISGTGTSGTIQAKDIAQAVLDAMGKDIDGFTAGASGITDWSNANFNGGAKYDVSISGNKLVFTLKDTPTPDNIKGDFDWDVSAGTTKKNLKFKDGSTHPAGTFVSQAGSYASSGTVANTVFRMSKDDFKDGSIIHFDGKEYLVAVGDENTSDYWDSAKVKLSKNDTLDDALAKLVEAIGSKSDHFVVGVNDKLNGDLNQGLAVQRRTDKNFDDRYTNAEELGAVFAVETTTASSDAKALQLQIGDTSDDYNQLKVSIGDMHTEALGIDTMSIDTAENAAKAIETIRSAINRVSSVRGDLGATQNRLEHTANNLSVMAENIQDAESTIRDTDVAEEMMAYTKNNILIQSAQAMLAQANAVPQGVLQLLG